MDKAEISKKTIVRISLLAAGVLVVLLTLVFSLEKINVPEEFTQARHEAARASKEMSNILNDSVENLSLIARYEREGRINDARTLVQEEIEKAESRNQAAVALATATKDMAESAREINLSVAKEKITEAVSSQITAIAHIVNYNLLLERLLVTIDNGLAPTSKSKEDRINQLLVSLNEDASYINELNEDFTSTLEEFDSIVRTKVQ